MGCAVSFFGPFYLNLSQINLSQSSKFRGNESEHFIPSKLNLLCNLKLPNSLK